MTSCFRFALLMTVVVCLTGTAASDPGEPPPEKSALERGDIFTILKQEEVQADLEIVPDQSQRFTQIARERMIAINKVGLAYEQAGPEERAAVNATFREKCGILMHGRWRFFSRTSGRVSSKSLPSG